VVDAVEAELLDPLSWQRARISITTDRSCSSGGRYLMKASAMAE
jgi:hypothetical protein